MDVKQFVAETLKEVINGVAEAQAHASSAGAIVNANLIQYTSGNWNYPKHPSFSAPINIEFDVAVTVAENKDLKGGIGIMVAGIGYQAKKEATRSEVSRIKFSIPVVLPSQPRLPVPKE